MADQVAARIADPEIPVEAHLDADVSWAVSPIADTFRNVVVDAHFEPADADRRIAEIRDTYARGDTGFVWWVAPFDRPADLGTRLASAGLVLEGNAPAMAAILDDVPLDEPPPDGLEIVPVTDAGDPPGVPHDRRGGLARVGRRRGDADPTKDPGRVRPRGAAASPIGARAAPVARARRRPAGGHVTRLASAAGRRGCTRS